MRQKRYYVYILTNRSKTLYVGITSNLEGRIWQHKNHVFPGFTDHYQIDRLVWFETYGDVHAAIAREKEIKGWTRARKMALVVASNPTWRDLSEDWGKPIQLGPASRNT
jgi:putative endonuclease